MQSLGGGGGQIRCIMGDVQVAEMLQVKLLYLFRVKSFNLSWFSISFVSLPLFMNKGKETKENEN